GSTKSRSVTPSFPARYSSVFPPSSTSTWASSLRYDQRFSLMKSDGIAYGIAGILFGLIAGWIIGSQQANLRPGPAAPAQSAQSGKSGQTGQGGGGETRAAALDETH